MIILTDAQDNHANCLSKFQYFDMFITQPQHDVNIECTSRNLELTLYLRNFDASTCT